MMSELTGHPQNVIVNRYLFLPQIYWLLIRNSSNSKISYLFDDPDLIPSWEQGFFKSLKNLKMIDGDELEEEHYWSRDFSTEIKRKIESGETFATKASVRDYIQGNPQSGVYKLINNKERIDRKVVPPAEAIGLIAFHGGKRNIPDDKPSEFFFKLFEKPVDGEMAAILLYVSRLPLS